jgi:hypothetical protein
MKTETNHKGETRTVVQRDDDGTVWWQRPGETQEYWDTAKEWREWMTGVKEKRG